MATGSMGPVKSPRIGERARSAWGALRPGGVAAVLSILIALVGAASPVSAQQATGPVEVNSLPVEGSLFNATAHPFDPDLVSVERTREGRGELLIVHVPSDSVVSLGGDETEEEMPVVDPLAAWDTDLDDPDSKMPAGFLGELAWRPILDAEERRWFAFVGPRSDGGFGLRLGWARADDQGGLEVETRTVAVDQVADASVRTPVWSSDGRSIAFSTGTAIQVVPDARSLLQGEDQAKAVTVATNELGIGFPSWAPDGSSIAFQEVSPDRGLSRVAAVNLRGDRDGASGDPVALTAAEPDMNHLRPSWSPDGRFVAVLSDQTGLMTQPGDRPLGIRVIQIQRDPDGIPFRGEFLEGASRFVGGHDRTVREGPRSYRGISWVTTYSGEGASTQVLLFVTADPDNRDPVSLAHVERWRRNLRPEEYLGDYSLLEEWGTVNHTNATASNLPGGGRIFFISQADGTQKLQYRDSYSPSQRMTQGNEVTAPVELSRFKAFRRALFYPGGGHYYRRQHLRGALYTLGAVAAGASMISPGRSFPDDVKDDARKVAKARETYLNDRTQDNLETWEEKWEEFDATPTADRTPMYIALGVVWAASVVDAVIGLPNTVERPLKAVSADSGRAPGLALQPTVVPTGSHGFGSARSVRIGLDLRVPLGGGNR